MTIESDKAHHGVDPQSAPAGVVLVLLPLMILPLYSVMVRIDPAWLRAARSLGAQPRQVWRRDGAVGP